MSARYARAMRHLPSALRFGAALLLAACAGDPAPERRTQDAPPIECARPSRIGGELQIVGATIADLIHGPCGHVVVLREGLFDPELALVHTLEGIGRIFGFAPTGEAFLAASAGGELALLDLDTLALQQLGSTSTNAGFAARRDRTRSLAWFCDGEAISVVDLGETRVVVHDADCEAQLDLAGLVPILLYRTTSGQLATVDLESEETVITGLETQDGQPTIRADGTEGWRYETTRLAPDGSRLLIMRGVEGPGTPLFHGGGSWIYEADPFVSVVDLPSGIVREIATPYADRYVQYERVPDAPGALAWSGPGGVPTVVVHENGEVLEIADYQLLSLAGTRTLGYRSAGADAIEWAWIDLRDGSATPVAEALPLRRYRPEEPYAPLLASPNGRYFALVDPDTGHTRTFDPDDGWRTVPARVGWLHDDGSMITPDPPSWLRIDGSIIASFAPTWRSSQPAGNRHFVETAGLLYVLDLQRHTVRALAEAGGHWTATSNGTRLVRELPQDASGNRVLWIGTP